jgi:hypothetical protein
LHHRIEVLQIAVREVGDIGAMIEINRLGRQRLAGQIDVIRARAAAAAESATPRATARGGRAEIKNMERSGASAAKVLRASSPPVKRIRIGFKLFM